MALSIYAALRDQSITRYDESRSEMDQSREVFAEECLRALEADVFEDFSDLAIIAAQRGLPDGPVEMQVVAANAWMEGALAGAKAATKALKERA